MTLNRRTFASLPVLGVAACSPSIDPARRPSPRRGEGRTAASPSPSAAPNDDELASPNPNLRFPAAKRGLVVGEVVIVAPTTTQLVTWDPDGKVVAAKALADVGIDDVPNPGFQDWDLRNGTFVVGGGSHYSWAAAGFEPWAAKGAGKVEHAEPKPSGSTEPRSNYQTPGSVSTDGSHVAASFFDGTVRVFEVGGRLVREFRPIGVTDRLDSQDLGVRYLPGDVLLVWGRGVACPVQAWKPDGSALVRRFDTGPTTPVHAALGPDGATLLVTAHDQGTGKMPWWVLDASTFGEQRRGELPMAASAVALSPGGSLVAGGADTSGKQPLQITVINGTDGTSHSFHREGYVAQSMAFSMDGKVLYTHNAKAGIVAWDAASGKELRQFGLP